MNAMLRIWASAREPLSAPVIAEATSAVAPVVIRGSTPEHMEVPEPAPVSAMENVKMPGRPGAIVVVQCAVAGEVAISGDVSVSAEAPPETCVLLVVTIGDPGAVLCAAVGQVKEEDAADDDVDEDAEEAAEDASLTAG